MSSATGRSLTRAGWAASCPAPYWPPAKQVLCFQVLNAKWAEFRRTPCQSRDSAYSPAMRTRR
jgi:hypothetical protein